VAGVGVCYLGNKGTRHLKKGVRVDSQFFSKTTLGFNFCKTVLGDYTQLGEVNSFFLAIKFNKY
jgi:hypothetical protein